MKKRDDVLFLCQFFYPEHNSSATLPFDTAKYLADHGLKVGAIVGYPKEYSDGVEVPINETVDGVRIHRLKYIQLKRTGRIGRLINYFSFTVRAFFNLKTLRNYKCVIVYSNPPVLPVVPIIAKKIYGTNYIFVAYDVYPEVAYASHSITKGNLLDKVMHRINNELYSNSSRVVALTDEMKTFLLDNRKDLSEESVVTIPNWAHEGKVELQHGYYEKFGYNEDQFIVAYFGNMGTCQDMETIIDAIQKLKNNDKIQFLFIGHGNKKGLLENRLKDLSNVKILDFLTGTDFEQAVAIASITIVSLEEGLIGTCAPSKYYSYLQGGKPVITISEKESYLKKEVDEFKVGIAIENGHSEELVDAVLFLTNNRIACKEMEGRARKLYEEKYSIEIGLSKYKALVDKVIMDV